ncbi:MAG: carbamoyltransferase HypF [Desulfuromonadaceae bacterium]|nr:carbamoyltransferase HypF [Desulfuromonadaceae bacterium]
MRRRQRHAIQGIVQGVGFRPFVYRLAHKLNMTGWVRNTAAGVEIEIEGSPAQHDAFENALQYTLPPLAHVTSHICTSAPLCREKSFTILPSGEGGADVHIAPDSAVCPDCLRELFDPADRRFRYPFITCTNCGPRYSIITGVPYDRPATTMAGFPLCPECMIEYGNPLDRRFHAQPIACHRCGPRVSLLSSEGKIISSHDDAVILATELLKDGAILAIKGIGGFHLAVDACNNNAVRRLRQRKKRDEKPFAVMAASQSTAGKLAVMNEMENLLLSSPEAPIVIVKKRLESSLSPLIAPDNGWIGVMLPYAPLHHLLLRDNFQALVMTSGNISDEPVAFEDADALQRLGGIADFFLLHDRPIHVRSDDSVMRVFQGKPLFYRRARGFAPRAVKLPFAVQPLLATGAELKNTVCLADGTRAVLSQHIGDLQNSAVFESISATVAHLSEILAISPEQAACDLHPDYLSSRYAEKRALPLLRVQHHHAHLASCMAENSLEGEVIGIIFDGTGYGSDSTVWGGEFLVGGYDEFRRAAHFRPLPLPGGDSAVREPWRMALAYLYQAMGEAAFSLDHPVARILPESERGLFAQMLRRGINSPATSSCGRLFDAVAALLNIRHRVTYEGQAALELEACAELAEGAYNACVPYMFEIMVQQPVQVDFSSAIVEILRDLTVGTGVSVIAHRFHQTVASAATKVCLRIANDTGHDRIILSGGVFQNRLLSEMLYTGLSNAGLNVFTHRLVPPNDGGIALGQAAIAGRRRG